MVKRRLLLLGLLIGVQLAGTAQLRWNYDTVLEQAATLTKQLYIFPTIGKQLQQDILTFAKDKSFQYLSPTEFADSLTYFLRKNSGDQHFMLSYYSTPTTDEAAYNNRIESNTKGGRAGFEEVRFFPGNIGYINYTYFASKKDSKQELALVMTALSSTDALIIDLRNNQGGYVETMLLFSSYFFKKRTKLSSTFYRHEQRRVRNVTKAKVKGEKYLYRPVYLLTSTQTRSAAEALSYHLQQYRVGVVVGDTTAGVSNPVELHIVDDVFCFFVPVGEETSTITGRNWEKTGVFPDLETSPEQALAKAQIRALNSILNLGKQNLGEQQELKKRIQTLEQSILAQDL